MLNIDSRMEILGITVLQDADRPTDFYYLPGSPHITRENDSPLFDLFSYRKGGDAAATLSGGFLNMTVDLSLGELKDRIEQRLKSQYGDEVHLASVPFTKGTARVIGLGEDSSAPGGSSSGDSPAASGPHFIQNILGAGKPSLDNDNRAIFSFSLNEDGAAFLLNTLAQAPDARAIGVVYELEYVGLLPSYELEIEIDIKSSYEFLRSRFTLNTIVFNLDIDNVTEELKRNEQIKIREVARTLDLSTPDAIHERQSRINQLVKDLAMGTFFQPSLIPGAPRAMGDGRTAGGGTAPATGGTAPSGGTSASGGSPAGGTSASGGSPAGGGATPASGGSGSTSGAPATPGAGSASSGTRPPTAGGGAAPGSGSATPGNMAMASGGPTVAASAPATLSGEIDTESDPAPAGSGTSGGASGTSGGASGTSGGASGTSGGASGTSGGASGTSGGASGTSGGASGTSGGASGTSGGTSGTPGGASGTPGGASGTPGGASGTPGGASGTPGGASGTPGGTRPGTGGASGTPGAGGTPGTGGDRPKTATDVWDSLGRPQAAFALRDIRQEEQRKVTYSLNQITAQKQTIAPQSFIQFLANTDELSQRVHVVDLNHPFFKRLNININVLDVDFAAEGVTQMTVQLRYSSQPNGTGPKDTAEAILRSRADSRDFTFFMDSELTQHYEYKLIVDYQDHFGIGAHDTRLESEWITTEARSLSVHPSWLGRVLPIALQLAPNIPEDVSEVHARVHYANAARNIDDTTLVRLSVQNRSQLVHIRLVDANEQFEVAQTLFYKDGTREDLPLLRLPDPTVGSADEAIVISAPRANRLDADVIMSDPLGELKSVLVDTQTLQNGGILDSRTMELTGAGQRQVWSVRLPQRGAPATLRFKERRIYKDGGLDSDDWREANSPNLVAGIPAGGIFPVTVKYVGPNPSALNLNAILVELEFKDPSGNPKYEQQETLLIDDSPNSRVQDWIIRRPDRNVQPEYGWRLTLLQADGGEHSTEFRADTHQTLFVRAPQP